jgi:hypothetical protein
MLAALAFICLPDIAYAAIDTRCYALGVMLVAASTLAFMSWLDTAARRSALAYVLLAALSVYAHYFAVFGLAAHLVYAWRRRYEGSTTVAWGWLTGAWVSTGMLTAPLLPKLLEAAATRGDHGYAARPGPGDLAAALLPPILVISLLLGITISLLRRVRVAPVWPLCGSGLMLAISWAAIPPLVMFLVSTFTDAKVFLPRYYLAAAPGVALIAGAALRSLASAEARRTAAGALAIFAVLFLGVSRKFQHDVQDWRGALTELRSLVKDPAIPVAIPSPFIEAHSLATLADPRFHDALFSPLLYYGSAGKLVRLPFQLSPQAEQYAEQVTQSELGRANEFIFLSLPNGYAQELWLRGRARAMGFLPHREQDFGVVRIVVFRRAGGDTAAVKDRARNKTKNNHSQDTSEDTLATATFSRPQRAEPAC